MRPRIFLTRELPPEPMRLLREQTTMEMNVEDRTLNKAELIAGVRGKDGLLCLLTDSIDAEVMDAGADLKVIANFAVGYNNIDADAARERGVVVTNTPGVLTDTTADQAFALLMAAARRVVEGDSLVRSGEWTGWGPVQMLGADVSGATLGIVGMGRIGQAMARRARGFDMDVVYWDPQPLSDGEAEMLNVRFAPLEELLAAADFVSIHVAMNEETRHLLDERRIDMMKSSAILINTARGPIVDEAALARALAGKSIAAAALDVYEREPRVAPALLTMPNVVLAPHLGSATIGTRTKMGLMAVENLLAGCQGQTPPNAIS